MTSVACGQGAEKTKVLKWKIVAITNELACLIKEVYTHVCVCVCVSVCVCARERVRKCICT